MATSIIAENRKPRESPQNMLQSIYKNISRALQIWTAINIIPLPMIF
jgi:hypothetical protein